MKTGKTGMQGVVQLAHGSGGLNSRDLISELFLTHFDNPLLAAGNDSAVFAHGGGRLAISTDGHVISPLFFPGGNIGSLAVHGTINDIAMSGARPLHLAAGFILEAGYPLANLEKIVISMAEAASDAGVTIVTGDTKVVEKGQADGVFITTTGVGQIPDGIQISGDRARPGDAILLSGTIGDHGVTIMSSRENLGFQTDLQSDSAALHNLVAAMTDAVPDIHCLRDPTRGGLATTLNELAQQSGVGMQLLEEAIPVSPGVTSACELLGLDPLYVANEGKLVAICDAADADQLLEVMRGHPHGRQAALIGHVTKDSASFVQLQTRFGGQRLVDWLAGEQLPRIC